MRCWSPLFLSLSVLLGTASSGMTQPQENSWLMVGPLPALAGESRSATSSPWVSTSQTVFELRPSSPFPKEGEEIGGVLGKGHDWAKVSESALAASQPGVYWLATSLTLNRWSEIDFSFDAPGELDLFLNGAWVGNRTARESSEKWSCTKSLRRGHHDLRLRWVVSGSSKSSIGFGMMGTPDPSAQRSSARRPRIDGLERAQSIPSFSAAVIHDDGTVAMKKRMPGPSGALYSTLDLIDAKGTILSSNFFDSRSTPLAFSPQAKQLLLSIPGGKGTDLWLWSPQGSRPVLRDEEGFAWAKFRADGQMLLVASKQGTSDVSGKDPLYRSVLRQDLPDYDTQTHLHIIDLESGLRRRITEPGDYALDDAVWSADGDFALVALTLPMKERPWFSTEIRRVGLEGSSETLARFVAGWEVRPQSLAASPDGRWLAFVGPPHSLESGQPENNVYNKQVYALDLETNTVSRISSDSPSTYGGRSGSALWFDPTGNLWATLHVGSMKGLTSFEWRDDLWRRKDRLQSSPYLDRISLSPSASRAVYVKGGRLNPGTLCQMHLEPRAEVELDAAPDQWIQDWVLPEVKDVSVIGPGGEQIDTWAYSPVGTSADEKVPLIVYYYGGATPTTQRFDTTHLMFASQGYAVLICNPRGSYGYGDSFARHHAGDWGPKASADVLAAVDAYVAKNPQVDSERVGIYGGSYGGFLTEYLISASDRFAAAVSLYGISDLATYWGQGAWGWTYGDMALGGLYPWRDRDYFAEHSPLFRADKIHTPLLLLHGIADTNVTAGESRQLFTALKVLGRPVEMVLFPNEDHGISSSMTKRIEHRTMMLEYFDAKLKEQPEAWQARWR